MSAPNIAALTALTLKTAAQAITTNATAIVSNAAASGTVVRVAGLYISNVDGTNACNLTVDVYRSDTAYKTHNLIAVPARTTLVAIAKDAPIYLEEGDSLRLTASADSDLEAVCTYEILA